MRGVFVTPDEERAMALTAELTGALRLIVGAGRTRESDLAEVLGHVHVIQAYIMSQGTARAFPDRYRELGGVIAGD